MIKSNILGKEKGRLLLGKVISDKMDKTVTVLVERDVKHPVIGKVIVRSKKYHAHNDQLNLALGDSVIIQECPPVSKTKKWIVVKKI